MERVRGFEDLDVFQRAYRVSLEVHRASLEFPWLEQFALADPVRRASKSICANLVEGFGRQGWSKSEFRRFLMMAVRPTRCRYRRSTARDLGYIDSVVAEHWQAEYREIGRMLRV
jgi:four helix bundle protein